MFIIYKICSIIKYDIYIENGEDTMNINVENIKVLKVEHNGETIVFKSDDIVSLEYKSVSIKGRIAQIGDTAITVDCSTMYNSQIHEVAVKNIEMIVKETAFNKQREDKLTVESAPAIQLEENESEAEELKLNNNTSSDEEENRALEPILTAKEKNTVSTLDAAEAEKTKEEEELDESVSLFGNIKRNYAQGISPIFNK